MDELQMIQCPGNIVITGVGMVTPLGHDASIVLHGIGDGKTAAAPPTTFDPDSFACRVCAEIPDFDAEQYFPENKTLRMMSDDAQLAVVAGKKAMEDAGIEVDRDYNSDDIALFGSTGLASVPIDEIKRIVSNAAGDDGQLDMNRFASVTLKRLRPVFSFKLLANMPVCFVSMFENIRGPNGIYTPWEGQGAYALIRAACEIAAGRAKCAMAGGCDSRTSLISFLTLQQYGMLDSWKSGRGLIPGQGSAFLILEDQQAAMKRDARIYARLAGWQIRTTNGSHSADDYMDVTSATCNDADLVLAGTSDLPDLREAEKNAIGSVAPNAEILYPKDHAGDLFAAAAGVQAGLGAAACGSNRYNRVAINCFGHGSQIAGFVLEAV